LKRPIKKITTENFIRLFTDRHKTY